MLARGSAAYTSKGKHPKSYTRLVAGTAPSKCKLGKLKNQSLWLAGLDKTAIAFDKTATAAYGLDRMALREKNGSA